MQVKQIDQIAGATTTTNLKFVASQNNGTPTVVTVTDTQIKEIAKIGAATVDNWTKNW